MGIALAPDPTLTGDPNNPNKPKPLGQQPTPGPGGASSSVPGAPAAPAAVPGPGGASPATPAPASLSLAPGLPTEYPSAPSTTGTPQNRLDLATEAFDTFAKSTAPQYTADLREATQKAAGMGQIGSGGLRTTYGNLANQRALALDTERSNLINAATTGTIADQQAGRGLDISQQNADTSRIATTGNLALSQAQLDLQSKLGLGNLSIEQQRAAIAKQEADANAAYQAGTLTLAEKDQKLAELKQAADITDQQSRLELAKTGQAADITHQQQTLQLQQKAEAAQEAYQSGTLTLAERDEALKELAQSQGNTVEQEKLELAHEQLSQQGEQFGLSLDQQKELAQLADATQNRALDISSAQGQNTLLLELARIMGGPSGNVNPDFLKAVAKALGLVIPTTTNTTPTVTNPPGKTPGDNPTTTTTNPAQT